MINKKTDYEYPESFPTPSCSSDKHTECKGESNISGLRSIIRPCNCKCHNRFLTDQITVVSTEAGATK